MRFLFAFLILTSSPALPATTTTRRPSLAQNCETLSDAIESFKRADIGMFNRSYTELMCGEFPDDKNYVGRCVKTMRAFYNQFCSMNK